MSAHPSAEATRAARRTHREHRGRTPCGRGWAPRRRSVRHGSAAMPRSRDRPGVVRTRMSRAHWSQAAAMEGAGGQAAGSWVARRTAKMAVCSMRSAVSGLTIRSGLTPPSSSDLSCSTSLLLMASTALLRTKVSASIAEGRRERASSSGSGGGGGTKQRTRQTRCRWCCRCRRCSCADANRRIQSPRPRRTRPCDPAPQSIVAVRLSHTSSLAQTASAIHTLLHPHSHSSFQPPSRSPTHDIHHKRASLVRWLVRGAVCHWRAAVSDLSLDISRSLGLSLSRSLFCVD